jgi:uncharacterized damage-inducible protein DinB
LKAGQIRELYQYHFATNKKIWRQSIHHLSEDQFVQEIPGFGTSVRNVLVHMIDIDRGWFLMIQGQPWMGTSDLAGYPDRESVQAYQAHTESMMNEYLDQLGDETAAARFAFAPEAMKVWHALLHVITHGVDHRSRLLAMLDQLGVETIEQDLALYLFGGEWPAG